MAPALVLALAALAPTINMSSSCHGEEKGLPKDQRASTYNICMQAEQAAQAELNKKWSSFPTAARAAVRRLGADVRQLRRIAGVHRNQSRRRLAGPCQITAAWRRVDIWRRAIKVGQLVRSELGEQWQPA